MSNYNYDSPNPYEVLGLSIGATVEEAREACLKAKEAAGNDHGQQLKATEALHKILTDIRVMESGRPSTYQFVSSTAFTEQAPGHCTPVPVYQEAGTGRGRSSSRGSNTRTRAKESSSWGPTVTGQIIDEDEFNAYTTHEPNPYEKRLPPGFGSREFFDWQQEFNQAEFQINAFPKGRANPWVSLGLVMASLGGMFLNFWIFVGGLISAFAYSSEGREYATDEYLRTSTNIFMGAATAIIFFFALMFVPLWLKRRNRKVTRTKYENLYRLGMRNGWLG